MERDHLAWLASLPFVAAGGIAAHAVAYAAVAPDAQARQTLLAATGHGYLAAWELPVAAGVGLGAVALVRSAWTAGRGARTPPAWLFALLPALGFALQEHAERLAHDGAFPVGLALQPVFLLGLALQIPFGLGAWLAVRAIVRGTAALARVLGASGVRPPTRASRVGARPAVVHLPRIAPLASGVARRGPPLIA